MIPLLSAKGITVTLKDKKVETAKTAKKAKLLLHNFSVTIHAGEMWAILGRNGVGKSTLLHTFAGLHKADKGEIAIAGDALQQLSRVQIARRLAILLQNCADIFPTTVHDLVMAGRYPYLHAWQREFDRLRHHERSAYRFRA